MDWPLLTLEQAAAQVGRACVYGLFDESGLFYIGKTSRPEIRFGRDYAKDRLKITNAYLLHRLNAAKDNLRVMVLQYPHPSRLAKAEKQEIEKNAARLTNIVYNQFSKWKCRGCDSVKKPSERFCGACTHKLKVQ